MIEQSKKIENLLKQLQKEEKKRWYAIPPYKNEGWKLLNDNGEQVAVFERKEDCILTAELFNNK